MINEYRILYDTNELPVQVIRSKRKTMAVQVTTDCKVIVRVPFGVSDRNIQDFITRHRGWIVQKYMEASVRKKQSQQSDIPLYESLDSRTKKRIKETITEKVRDYSQIMGVTVGRVSIRNQKTRWGSCSSKGNVNFNYRLYYMPESLLNYVVIHELAHRKHMNHSPRFWEEVSKYCPDYRECRKQLRDYPLR